MNIRRSAVFSVLAAMVFFSACGNSQQTPQKVNNGVLDLRSAGLPEKETLHLEGSWEFLKGGDETGTAMGSDISGKWQTIPVPKSWNYVVKKGLGYGWYRCRVLLPQNMPAKDIAELALNIESIYTAYTLYINGRTITSAGTVGKDASNAVPQLINNTVTLGLEGSEKSFDIVLHVSNFHHARGGMRGAPVLGRYKEIQRSLWIRDMFDIFILGIILMMAVNQLIFWLGRRNELSLLTFSGLCFFFCLRVIARNNYLAQLFSQYNLFELRYLMEYFSITTGCIFLTIFSSKLFPKESSKLVTRIVAGWGILILLFLLATPCSFYSKYVNLIFLMILLSCLWIIITTAIAVKRGRKGALLILFGFLVFTLTIANDILLSKALVFTANISHIGLAVMVFSQSVVLSFRYKTALETEIRSKELERELVIARKIQQKLLPRIAPSTEGMSMHMICLPMDQVGGDFYDYSITNDSVSLFIADVSGHGLASSFLSLITKTALANTLNRDDAVGVMKYLNRIVTESAVNSHFVTAFYCVIDKKNRLMRYTRAGHPPALLYRRQDGSIAELNSTGCALGMSADFYGNEKVIQLVPGDRVILYTDGITECMDAAGNLYGYERLTDFLRTHDASSAEHFSEELIQELKRYSGPTRFSDDLTLVVLDIVVV